MLSKARSDNNQFRIWRGFLLASSNFDANFRVLVLRTSVFEYFRLKESRGRCRYQYRPRQSLVRREQLLLGFRIPLLLSLPTATISRSAPALTAVSSGSGGVSKLTSLLPSEVRLTSTPASGGRRKSNSLYVRLSSEQVSGSEVLNSFTSGSVSTGRGEVRISALRSHIPLG